MVSANKDKIYTSPYGRATTPLVFESHAISLTKKDNRSCVYMDEISLDTKTRVN